MAERINGYWTRLECPECNERCETIEPISEQRALAEYGHNFPTFVDGTRGTCHCGAALVVHCADGNAWLEEDDQRPDNQTIEEAARVFVVFCDITNGNPAVTVSEKQLMQKCQELAVFDMPAAQFETYERDVMARCQRGAS